VTARCLERAGARIVQVRDDRSLALRTPSLIGRLTRLKPDVIVVGFRAHADIPAAHLVGRRVGAPVIFDPLTSRYEEKVIDRKLVRAGSPLAWWYRTTDRIGCRQADRILLETEAQIDYFVQTFGVERGRFRRFWLGTDESVMRPRPRTAPTTGAFTVFFYGRFSPLHGVEHIIDAAAELERRHQAVRFVLVGAGQTYADARARATRLAVKSIEFPGVVSYTTLAAMMADADLCLGSFGMTARAQRVVPNKVFDALAMARPILTADTPGAREALTHGHDAWLCAPGNGGAIANAILDLKSDPARLTALADNGHALFRARFSSDALTDALTAIVRELVPARRSPARAHP